MKDFFWELIMLVYGDLTDLKNWKISLDKIIKLTYKECFPNIKQVFLLYLVGSLVTLIAY